MQKSRASNGDVAAWDEWFRHDGVVVFHGSRLKLAGMLAVCLAFTAGGIAMTFYPRFGGVGFLPSVDVMIGYLAIALFGLIGIPACLWKLITTPTVMRVDMHGVSVGREYVAWSDIRRVSRFSIQVLLVLTTRTADQRHASQPVWRRIYEKSNGLLEGDPVYSLPRALKNTNALGLEIWMSQMHRKFERGKST